MRVRLVTEGRSLHWVRGFLAGFTFLCNDDDVFPVARKVGSTYQILQPDDEAANGFNVREDEVFYPWSD